MKGLFLGVAAAAVLVSGLAYADAISDRQALMKKMSKSFEPIIAVLKGESIDFDAAGAAARTMNESMREAMTLFIKGTAAGEIPESRAKPEVWSKSGEFEAAGDDLINASAGLAEAATSGDINQFKSAFQPLATACGGCHEGPPREGGKFRTAKQ